MISSINTSLIMGGGFWKIVSGLGVEEVVVVAVGDEDVEDESGGCSAVAAVEGEEGGNFSL